MKLSFLSIIILISLQAVLIGQPQQNIVDTVPQHPATESSAASPDEVEELNKQLDELEKRLISFDSDRDYAGHILVIIGVIASVLIGISSLLGFYIIPLRQKEDYRKFEEEIRNRFEELETGINENASTIGPVAHEALITANRGQFAYNLDKKSHMTVVWCGRWLEAIYNSDRDIENEQLQKDIATILKRALLILEGHDEKERKHLKQFPSKGGVIRNFQTVANLNNRNIQRLTTEILHYLHHLWNDDTNG